ncbi:MAG TPA: DNA repair protein RecO [Firmicutes bacterium]|nr:DNA repair protein RecO [Bacillota bacterium]
MIKNWQSEAFVLWTKPYGEADKLVVLFTRRKGKVAAVARGARKAKSKLAGIVDMFVTGDYLLYQGKSLAIIRQAALLAEYSRLRESFEHYSHGVYLCELVNQVLEEACPAEALYDLMLMAFKALNRADSDPVLITRGFELLLLKELGYSPYLKGCLACGATAPPFIFSPAAGGLLCCRCSAGNKGTKGIALSQGSIALMKRILDRGLAGIGSLKAPAKVQDELNRLLWESITCNTGISGLKSKALLNYTWRG